MQDTRNEGGALIFTGTSCHFGFCGNVWDEVRLYDAGDGSSFTRPAFVQESGLTMSGKIEDPINASYAAFPDEPDGLGKTFADLTLSFSSLVFSPAAIAKILKDQFGTSSRFKRVEYLLDGFRLGIKGLESQVGSDREKMKEIQSQIEAPRFQEAVAAACEEAARGSSEKKVVRLAAILTGSLLPGKGNWADPDADLSAIIRDLAQLGDQDLRALGILRTAFAVVITGLPNLNDPNQFTERMQDYRTAIAQAQIQPEDFYGSCSRLSGFGLAIEVLRNPGRMEIHEYCYRPTRRGLALLEKLDRFGSGTS